MKISKSLIERERAKRSAPLAFDIKKYLFNKQFDFVNDPAPFKTAVCSRRSGKTIACAADLINTALNFNSVVCLYITLSRINAKKIIWPELKKINREHKLGGKEDAGELSMLMPNGSVIYCSGAKDATEIEKFRGLAIKKAYIDESQSFRAYIKDLIDDVIGASLLDHAGSLILIGTPGPIPAGYFYECAHNPNLWSHHAWTFFDNPFIKQKSGLSHEELLQRELSRRGVTKDDPSIRREFFGEWVLDSDALILHYSAEKNAYEELPNAKYTYIMGIDVGFDDADAIAVIAWSESSPVTYLVEERVTSKQGLTELVQQIKELQTKYGVAKMVIDQGGLGKKLAEEMRRQHHIPVHPADKTRKMEAYGFLDDALRTARFKARRNSIFAQDSYLLERDKDKSTPDKLVVSKSFHSDIVDAVLYAFKESPAFTYQAPVQKPKPGSEAFYDALTAELEEKALEHFTELEKAQNGSDEW